MSHTAQLKNYSYDYEFLSSKLVDMNGTFDKINWTAIDREVTLRNSKGKLGRIDMGNPKVPIDYSVVKVDKQGKLVCKLTLMTINHPVVDTVRFTCRNKQLSFYFRTRLSKQCQDVSPLSNQSGRIIFGG